MTTLKTCPKQYKNWKQEIGSCAAVLIRLAKPASSTAKIIPVGLHSGRSGDSQSLHACVSLDDRKR